METVFKNLHFTTVENLKETGQFLDIYGPSKLNQDEINNLNRSTISSRIEAMNNNIFSMLKKSSRKIHCRTVPDV